MARFGRPYGFAAAMAALVIGLGMIRPASALDDDGKKNIFSSVGELFTGGDSNNDIQYRERAPLVIPPSLQQLPPPRAAAATDAGWMHDRKASGLRNPTKVARSSDPDRGTLIEPPNDYFRKAGNKPLPPSPKSRGIINGFLSDLNPFKKEDD